MLKTQISGFWRRLLSRHKLPEAAAPKTQSRAVLPAKIAHRAEHDGEVTVFQELVQTAFNSGQTALQAQPPASFALRPHTGKTLAH